jgi:hypothetical protein
MTDNPYDYVFGRGGTANKLRTKSSAFNELVVSVAPMYKDSPYKRDFVKIYIYEEVIENGGKFYKEENGKKREVTDKEEILTKLMQKCRDFSKLANQDVSSPMTTSVKAKETSVAKKCTRQTPMKKGKAPKGNKRKTPRASKRLAAGRKTTVQKKSIVGRKKKKAVTKVSKTPQRPQVSIKKRLTRKTTNRAIAHDDDIPLGTTDVDAHSIEEVKNAETMDNFDDLLSVGDEEMESFDRTDPLVFDQQEQFDQINNVKPTEDDAEKGVGLTAHELDGEKVTGEDERGEVDNGQEVADEDAWLCHSIQPPPLECQHSFSAPALLLQQQHLDIGVVTMPVDEYQNLLAKLSILQNENAVLKAQKSKEYANMEH